MHELIMSIVFITGTSGSGKTTVMQKLQEHLSSSRFTVHDFDEVGVPQDADQAWRIATTKYWIEKAEQYYVENKITIICGVTAPSEVMQALQDKNMRPSFIFLKIDDSVIKKRLQARGWSEQLIQDNINWAHFLESEVRGCKQHLVVDSHDGKQIDIVQKIIEWIKIHLLF